MTIDDKAPASKPARRRVLVVEDEYLVAMLVEEMLDGLVYEVAQVAATLEAAMNAANNSSVDVAVLDVNLSGKHSGPVAEALAAPIPCNLNESSDKCSSSPRMEMRRSRWRSRR